MTDDGMTGLFCECLRVVIVFAIFHTCHRFWYALQTTQLAQVPRQGLVAGAQGPSAAEKKLVLQRALIRMVLANIPDMACMGLRLGMGGMQNTRRQMFVHVHPDRNGNSLESNEAMKKLADLFRDNQNIAFRKLKDFRDAPDRFDEEQDCVDALADLRNEPRPTRLPRAASQAAPEGGNGGPRREPPPAHRDYRILKEVVNLATITKFMEMAASRTLTLHDGQTLFEILDSVRRRARAIGKGLGEIVVVVWDCEHEVGFTGRRFTGCAGMDPEAIPPEVRHERSAGIPCSLCGLSAFALPRLVKCICRHKLQVVDIDAENCVFNIYCHQYPEYTSILKKTYMAMRLKFIEMGMDVYKCSKDLIKKLFIQVGFLGTYKAWLDTNGFERIPGEFSDTIEAIAREMHALALHVSALWVTRGSNGRCPTAGTYRPTAGPYRPTPALIIQRRPLSSNTGPYRPTVHWTISSLSPNGSLHDKPYRPTAYWTISLIVQRPIGR